MEILVAEDILHLLHVNMLRILLHDDGVKRISQLVRHSLRHELGAHRLGNSSFKVDTACYASELENLTVVFPILVLGGLDLHVLLLIE